MPFKKGDKQTSEWGKKGARKGYVIEAKNLAKMNKLFGKDLDLAEKVYKGKATEEEVEIFKIVQARILKYSDKLHATKTETDINNPDGNLKTIIINKSVEQNGNDKSIT